MYLSYTLKQQGGGPSEEAQGILSTSQQDPCNTTPLSLTTISCVGLRSLGTLLKTGGTLNDQQDRTIGVTYSRTKYKWQDK